MSVLYKLHFKCRHSYAMGFKIPESDDPHLAIVAVKEGSRCNHPVCRELLPGTYTIFSVWGQWVYQLLAPYYNDPKLNIGQHGPYILDSKAMGLPDLGSLSALFSSLLDCEIKGAVVLPGSYAKKFCYEYSVLAGMAKETGRVIPFTTDSDPLSVEDNTGAYGDSRETEDTVACYRLYFECKHNYILRYKIRGSGDPYHRVEATRRGSKCKHPNCETLAKGTYFLRSVSENWMYHPTIPDENNPEGIIVKGELYLLDSTDMVLPSPRNIAALFSTLPDKEIKDAVVIPGSIANRAIYRYMILVEILQKAGYQIPFETNSDPLRAGQVQVTHENVLDMWMKGLASAERGDMLNVSKEEGLDVKTETGVD